GLGVRAGVSHAAGDGSVRVGVSTGRRRGSRRRPVRVRTARVRSAMAVAMVRRDGAVALLIQVVGLIALALFLGLVLIGGSALVLHLGAGV
ncbi:MAG: hypothetical protein FWF75_07505, partial [Propionibacteriaceae bacterium]|nr:hypothetical protein [Propionibacteriaceae bacterium]